MKKTYYLFNPGILERKDNTLKFTPVAGESIGTEQSGSRGDSVYAGKNTATAVAEDYCPGDEDGKVSVGKPVGNPRYIPVEDVGEFYVFGSLYAGSSLFNFLGQSDISVHFFDYYENYSGSFMPREGLLSGRMIMAQAAHCKEMKKRLPIAVRLIDGAVYNMLKNLQYYNRRGKDMEPMIGLISGYAQQIANVKTIEELMGIEGMIRHTYYEAFDLILNDFSMGKRIKQPPGNEVNALISFGNMMCYTLCLRAIRQTQLNPTISFLHTPGERRYSLALDIAEIFKPLIIDRTIFKVLNKKELQEKHFDKKFNKCILNLSGKKIFVKAIEDKLQETFMHKTLNRNVSYRHLVKLECYKLAKHLLQIEDYKPFKMYW